jgi:hypothetical protein
MGVDQTGHYRRVTEIDHVHASRPRDGSARSRDSIPFDEDFTGADNLAVRNVEQACGTKDRGMLRSSLGGTGKRPDGESESTSECLHVA